MSDAIGTIASGKKTTGLQILGNDGTNSYAPKIDSTGNVSVQVSGRKATPKAITITSSTTIVANGGTESIQTAVPSGKKWTIQALQLQILNTADGGEVTGTHSVLCYITNTSGTVSIGNASSINFVKRIEYRGGFVDQTSAYLTGVIPDDHAAQTKLFNGIMLDANSQLRFDYINNTTANQTNARTLKLNVIEEDAI